VPSIVVASTSKSDAVQSLPFILTSEVKIFVVPTTVILPEVSVAELEAVPLFPTQVN